jgi:hydrogenase nickel incorporation protein HypA/HybF
MHEFSIAEAIAGQVARYARPGARVREVEIVVGALRGLEPEAMQMSWQAVTFETPLEGSVLTIESKPWTIDCGTCGREWSSRVPFVTCECGNETPDPHGSDELDLVAITVEDEEPDDGAPAAGTGPTADAGTATDEDGGAAPDRPVADWRPRPRTLRAAGANR